MNKDMQVGIVAHRPLPQLRSAIDMMRQFLENLHANTFNVNPTALVPLPDRPDLDIPNLDIVQAESDQGLDFEFTPCAERSYSVHELLYGFRPKEVAGTPIKYNAFVNWSNPQFNIK